MKRRSRFMDSVFEVVTLKEAKARQAQTKREQEEAAKRGVKP